MVPLIVICPVGYIPTSPYAKLSVAVVAVDGDGELDAVTPCVDVPPLTSAIVCVNVVLVNVTAVSLISNTSFAVTVGFTWEPVIDDGTASAIFKNCILPEVDVVVNPPAVLLSVYIKSPTLPGIAGIVLSVGMAVDANVLIFERIKEELKGEKNNIIAFDSGYIKSRTAIIDANITTLLAAIILFFMGSGPIKGFSITLGVGIFTTLFSVYFIARLFTSIYVSKNRNKEKLI